MLLLFDELVVVIVVVLVRWCVLFDEGDVGVV